MKIFQMSIELDEVVEVPSGMDIIGIELNPESKILDISALVFGEPPLVKARYHVIKDIWKQASTTDDWFVAFVKGNQALLGTYKV